MSDSTPNNDLTPLNPIADVDNDFLSGGIANKPRAASPLVRRLIVLMVLVAIGVGGYAFVFKSGKTDPAMAQGKMALTEAQLKKVITERHLTAFWTGPMEGAKYALTITNSGQVYIRYLPGGTGATDVRGIYRVVGSYPFPKAYEWAVSNGTLPGIIGLTNPDGFAIFYNTASTNNVYLATKSKDVQIEIFDPIANQARALAMIKGQVQQLA